ncbi:MAG: hypothetical protein KIT09_04905 [Bryobacteraceae bacterium]|nr:hypothetical protein [Bryobacteraceae bacterium]
MNNLLRVAVCLLFAALAAHNQENRNPHGGMTECGRKMMSCMCPKIVDDIQQYEVAKCQKAPADQKKDCLKSAYQRTTHCRVMADAHRVPEWNQFVRKNGILKMCGTQCHPEKCKCNADQPCAPH